METVVRGLTIRHAIPSSEVGRGVKVRPTEPSGTRVNSRQTVKRKGTTAHGCKLGAEDYIVVNNDFTNDETKGGMKY